MQKIPTRLRGTNFCTSSARFAPCFVRQPNGPKCTQIVRNAAKLQFRVQWGGLVLLLRKIPTRLRGTNFCTSSARCAPSFVRQLKDPESTQIVQNAPKHQFSVQWGGSGAFVAKNSDATFVRQPNGLQCTQIVQNAPKHQFRVQWGGSDAFVAKNSDVTSWHELLH